MGRSRAMVSLGRPTSSTSPEAQALKHLVQAMLLLMTEEVAVGWFAAFFSSDGREFVGRNAWSSVQRNDLLISLIAGLATTLIVGVVAYRRGASQPLLRLAWLASPLIPLALVPGLLVPGLWASHPLQFLVCLVVLALLGEAFFGRAAREFIHLFRPQSRLKNFAFLRSRWLPLAFLALASLSYVVATGLITVWKHRGFSTGAYDLAIFDNMMWNAMHGAPYQSSIMYNDGPGNSLAGHAEIAMVLFVPFYAIAPSSEALLWIQAACLGLGAFPLYFLALHFVGAWYAVLISICYLIYAPLHGSQFYDYHWLTVITPFLFINFYSLAARKNKLTILSTVLLWLLREDVAPGLMMLGIVLAVSGYRVKPGLLLAVSSLTWFLLVKFVIMPAFGTWFFADLYSDLTTPTEKGYGSVIKTLLTNPLFVLQKLLTAAKLEYLLHILAPVALIPLRRVAFAAVLLPGAFFTIFTNSPPTFSITYQYPAHYVAYVFSTVVVFLGKLPSQAARLGTAATLLLTMICHSANFGALLRPSAFIGGSVVDIIQNRDRQAERREGLLKLRDQIPREASIIATTRETPHLSARARIYSFGHSRVRADYVVVHPQSFGMGSTNRDIWSVLGHGDYGLVAQEGQTTLWKRGHQSGDTEASLQQLRKQLGK